MMAAAIVAGCEGSRPSSVSVFPIPGSRVASPLTQIAFRGLPISRLGRVLVIGSRSGRHTGRLRADSDGEGGSFLPAKPFLPGERVTVRTSVRLRSGRRGFSFTVADPAPAPPSMSLPPAGRVPGDVLALRSRPDLAPAAVQITRPSAGVAEGDIFLAPQQGPIQSGPMILDPNGALVWFHPLPTGIVASDFRVQRYHGGPVLTWWQGRIGAGVGTGEDVIYDATYRQLAVVRAANGLSADLHEFLLTDDGRAALMTAYYPVYWDAASLHGPRRAIVLDSVVQEIDVKTGLVLFQWDSLDHIPLTDTYEPLPHSVGQPIDYFHVNSIQPDGADSLIISARNTWAAYKISLRTGRVIWRLGGKRSTFRMPQGSSFAFQHDVGVRAHDRTVTLFDDGAGPPKIHQQSRGLILRLDLHRHTARLIGEDRHSPPLLANYEGNVQELPNGDEFVGWGQQPYFTEFSSVGRMVFDGRFVGGNSSYRAYRFPWRGTPRTLPAVSAVTSGATTSVYVSWNGATDVASWQVMSGAAPGQLRIAVTARKRGFETQLTVPATSYVVVRALDVAGRVLATSAPVRPG